MVMDFHWRWKMSSYKGLFTVCVYYSWKHSPIIYFHCVEFWKLAYNAYHAYHRVLQTYIFCTFCEVEFPVSYRARVKPLLHHRVPLSPPRHTWIAFLHFSSFFIKDRAVRYFPIKLKLYKENKKENNEAFQSDCCYPSG